MLHYDHSRYHVVFPSWADGAGACSWDQLCQRVREEQAHEEVQSRSMPQVLKDGAAGGGIWIRGVTPLRTDRYLKERAVILPPDGPGPLDNELRPSVHYIEPARDPVRELSGHRRTYPVCAATPEHSDAARGGVYWVLDIKDDTVDSEHLDSSLADVAKGFGLSCKPADAVDSALRCETDAWFSEWPGWQRWYSIGGAGEEVNGNFAQLLYCAFALKRRYRALRWVHLVAQIEGRPIVRLRQTPSAIRQRLNDLPPEVLEKLRRKRGSGENRR